MLSDSKTNRAVCFGDHAMRGSSGISMGDGWQVLAGKDLADKTEPFVNFGPAPFLRNPTQESV